MRILNDVLGIYKGMDRSARRNLWMVCVTYFFILFTYPFLRATTTALYIQTFGAKATPVVWFLSVFVLSIVIFFYNKIQKKMGVHQLFFLTVLISAVIILGSLWGVNLGFKYFAYALYIWKEIYIVMLLGMVLGYANNFLNIDQAKIFLGVIGAFGSVGGVLGGIITSRISQSYGVNPAIILSTVFMVVNALIFFKTSRLSNEKESLKYSESPIVALRGAGKYVACICLIVALSQFCINVANLEFNLVFEKIVSDVNEKAGYLGKFYALVNFVTLVIQIAVLPFILSRFNMKTVHLFIPTFYFIVIFMGLGIGGHLLWAVGGTFIMLKGIDYSLLNVAKDILLYPLTPLQKYGAKYLSDMIVYRLAKALISFFLIYYQNIKILNILMVVFLTMWVGTIFKLYVFQKDLENKKQEDVL